MQDRFDRAQEHFNEIRSRLRAYYAADTHTIIGELHFNDLSYSMYVAAPEERLNTVIGEMLHNLRSSLDHLALIFVGLTPGDPTKDTTFPICKVRPTANKHGIQPPPPLAGGSTPEVMAFLDTHQPYQLETDFFFHGLWELHRLAIIDRHRHIVPSGVTLAPITWSYSGAPPTGSQHWTAQTHDADEYGAKLDLVLDVPDMNVEGHATLQILVNEPGPDGLDNPDPVLLMTLLNDVNDKVREIVIEAKTLFFT